MSFEADSQDSRDPNSPQWGYAKVTKPEKELQYPAKDKNWNEYLMFIYDSRVDLDEGICYKKSGALEARTPLECVMVPAKLTIDCEKAIDLTTEAWAKALENCKDHAEEAKIKERRKAHLDGLKKLPSGTITIPSSTEKNPDSTTLWVALVIGPQ